MLPDKSDLTVSEHVGTTGARGSQAAQLSRDQLDLIVDNLSAMVWTADPGGSRDFTNRPWLEYTGLTVEEALGKDFRAMHPGDRPEFLAKWEEAVESGVSLEREIRLRRSDGEYFWFLHRIVPSRGGSGDVLKWVAVITDIHSLKQSVGLLREDRERTEYARRQTEEEYLSVVESTTDAVITIDERNEIQFVNPAAIRTFGYEASELVGQQLTILMPEQMRPRHRAGLERYIHSGRRQVNLQAGELTGLRKNGEEFPIEVSMGEARKDGQRIFTGFIRDITMRKRAEAELRQLVDLVPQILVVMDANGRWIGANRVAREYTGLTLQEYPIFDVIDRVIHPDDIEKMQAVRQTGLSGIDPFELEARMRGKEGIYCWFLFRYNPLVEEARAQRWYVSATEIETRKQEEEQVRRENVRLEERNRIAQELHDTLLQTFMSASLHLGAALVSMDADSRVTRLLQRTAAIMEQGIVEGREAIFCLRSPDSRPSDLVFALSRLQDELEVDPSIAFCVNVSGSQKPLRPEIQHEVYRIGREALVNAFCHSGAKHVELKVEYSAVELGMWIRDDGSGIDPQILQAGREGHWGLRGMRERATKIGGELRISCDGISGTEVYLSAPGTVFEG